MKNNIDTYKKLFSRYAKEVGVYQAIKQGSIGKRKIFPSSYYDAYLNKNKIPKELKRNSALKNNWKNLIRPYELRLSKKIFNEFLKEQKITEEMLTNMAKNTYGVKLRTYYEYVKDWNYLYPFTFELYNYNNSWHKYYHNNFFKIIKNK